MKLKHLLVAAAAFTAFSGVDGRTFGPVSCTPNPCKADETCELLEVNNVTKGVSCSPHYIERNRFGPGGKYCDLSGSGYDEDHFSKDQLTYAHSFLFGFEFLFLATSLYLIVTFPKHVTIWSNFGLAIGLFLFSPNFHTARPFTYGASLGWWGKLHGDGDTRYGNPLLAVALTFIVFSQLIHLLTLYAVKMANMGVLPAAYLISDMNRPTRTLKNEETSKKKRSDTYKALLLVIEAAFLLMIVFALFLVGPLGKERDVCERLLVDSKATYWFYVVLAIVSGIVALLTFLSFLHGWCGTYISGKKLKANAGEITVHGGTFWSLYTDVMGAGSWWSKIILFVYSVFWLFSVALVLAFFIYQLVNYDSKKKNAFGFDTFDHAWTYLNAFVWSFLAVIIGLAVNVSLIANTTKRTAFISFDPVRRLYNKIVEYRTKKPEALKSEELRQEIDALASMRVSVSNLGGNIESAQATDESFTSKCDDAYRQRALYNTLHTKLDKLHKKLRKASGAPEKRKKNESDDDDSDEE